MIVGLFCLLLTGAQALKLQMNETVQRYSSCRSDDSCGKSPRGGSEYAGMPSTFDWSYCRCDGTCLGWSQSYGSQKNNAIAAGCKNEDFVDKYNCAWSGMYHRWGGGRDDACDCHYAFTIFGSTNAKDHKCDEICEYFAEKFDVVKGGRTGCDNKDCTQNEKHLTESGPCNSNWVYVPSPTPSPTPSPPVGGRGDPHMTNVNGDKFNIIRQGYAPLVSITSEGMPHLEVMALIQGVKKCQKKMFITQVNSSGSWLEKTVAVGVGAQYDGKAFSVTVDGQEVWSPVSRGYEPPATDNIVFTHADKFSINEVSIMRDGKGERQPSMELKTAHDVKLKIVRPLHRPNAPPHLNFDIQGLSKLPDSFALGGLLGEGDHSQWTARDHECVTNFVRTRSEDETFSVASAQ